MVAAALADLRDRAAGLGGLVAPAGADLVTFDWSVGALHST
jgi:hypothetical protein